MEPKSSIKIDPKHWSTLLMKKNILSVVAVGLVLSTVAGLVAAPAEACGNNNNNNNRNQSRQIRRMLQQQARLNQFNNPYYTQVNPSLYNSYYPVGYNPYSNGNQCGLRNQFGLGNQYGYGNQFNPYNNNYNSGLLGNGGLIGGGLQRVLGTLF